MLEERNREGEEGRRSGAGWVIECGVEKRGMQYE